MRGLVFVGDEELELRDFPDPEPGPGQAVVRMQAYAPVVFDATHSCQLPGAAGTLSGGQREYTGPLAAAAVATGADAIFLEVHDDPDRAKSDPATVYPLEQLDSLLAKLVRIAELVRS